MKRSEIDRSKVGKIHITLVGAANPYLPDEWILGDDRVELLDKFFNGEETPGYMFWFCPAEGGAEVIEDSTEMVEKILKNYLEDS